MRYAAFIIMSLSFLFFTVCQSSADESWRVEQTIINVFNAMSASDADALSGFLTDDFMLGEAGMVLNKYETVDLLKTAVNPVDVRVHTICPIQTHIDGNFAWIAYWNEARIISQADTLRVKWLESAALHKEKNEWKLMFAQATNLEDQHKQIEHEN